MTQIAFKVLVVGINPSNTSGSRTLKRLNSWMENLGIQHYSFINCLNHKGKYLLKQVDYSLIEQYSMGIEYYKILALGGFPSSVLHKLKIDHFKLPHPSPLNRKLNSQLFETSMLEECKAYLYD